MREWDVGAIQPGLEVCDKDGETIGEVAHLLRGIPAAAAGGGDAGSIGGAVIEVKTGLLGLGKHYYIPTSAVEEVTAAAVVLNRRRAEFAELG
jgi:hypothetical protein